MNHLWSCSATLCWLAIVPPALAGPPAMGPAAARRVGSEVPASILNDLKLLRADLLDVPALPVNEGAVLTIRLPIGDRDYTVDLTRHSNRAEGFRVRSQGQDGAWTVHEPAPIRTYRGTIRELPGAAAGVMLAPAGTLEGVFFLEDRTYYIEPLGRLRPDAGAGLGDRHIGYFAEDVIPEARECEGGILHDDLDYFQPDPGLEAGFSHCGGADPICVAELACDADTEYFHVHGSVSAVQSRIESVINAVNVQYERDVDITHAITEILVRTAEPDPYSSTASSTLLSQFRSEWLNNQGSVRRDMAQLFTGKNLDGSVIGSAYVSAVCTSSGYGIVQSDFNSSFACATDLSAHELGHNWGAGHCTCPSSTMNPSITCANVFHPSLTVPTITDFRDTRSCLEPAGPALDLSLNQGSFGTGDTLRLTAMVSPGNSAVDAYVGIQIPGGAFLYVLPDGTLSRTRQPFVAGWVPVAFDGQIFAHTFDGSEPQGSYSVWGVLTVPGTFDPIGGVDMNPFSVGPVAGTTP